MAARHDGHPGRRPGRAARDRPPRAAGRPALPGRDAPLAAGPDRAGPGGPPRAPRPPRLRLAGGHARRRSSTRRSARAASAWARRRGRSSACGASSSAPTRRGCATIRRLVCSGRRLLRGGLRPSGRRRSRRGAGPAQHRDPRARPGGHRSRSDAYRPESTTLSPETAREPGPSVRLPDALPGAPRLGRGHRAPGDVLADREDRMRLAIRLASENVARGTGGPFGAAVIERDTGRVVSVGVNVVVPSGCSLAHAEAMALALAQQAAGSARPGRARPPRDGAGLQRPAVLPVLWDGLVVGGPGPDHRRPRRGRRVDRRLPRRPAPARLGRPAPPPFRPAARRGRAATSSATRPSPRSTPSAPRAGRPTTPAAVPEALGVAPPPD